MSKKTTFGEQENIPKDGDGSVAEDLARDKQRRN
jgi:hypothetical protein